MIDSDLKPSYYLEIVGDGVFDCRGGDNRGAKVAVGQVVDFSVWTRMSTDKGKMVDHLTVIGCNQKNGRVCGLSGRSCLCVVLGAMESEKFLTIIGGFEGRTRERAQIDIDR